MNNGLETLMTLSTRQNEIIDLLRDNGKVDVDQLAVRFDVTAQTVRRDLGDLCDRGLAMRTHGGARRVLSTSSRGYEERRLSFAVEKAAIGNHAAQLIPNNCSVFLNIGTTTEQVAKALVGHTDLTVISNNINVIQIFMNTQLRELVLVGGAVRQSDGAIVGNQAVEFIGRYKADFAVIGASSMDSDGSILDFDDREVAVARAILRNARIKVLVTDISKFESVIFLKKYNKDRVYIVINHPKSLKVNSGLLPYEKFKNIKTITLYEYYKIIEVKKNENI